MENVFPFRSIILKMVIRKWNDTIRVGFHYDEKIVSSLLGWKSFALLVYLRFDTNFVIHLIYDIMILYLEMFSSIPDNKALFAAWRPQTGLCDKKSSE